MSFIQIRDDIYKKFENLEILDIHRLEVGMGVGKGGQGGAMAFQKYYF